MNVVLLAAAALALLVVAAAEARSRRDGRFARRLPVCASALSAAIGAGRAGADPSAHLHTNDAHTNVAVLDDYRRAVAGGRRNRASYPGSFPASCDATPRSLS